MLNKKSKNHFIEEIVDFAMEAKQIPLSIFANLFNQFETHLMFESMLEILQQFYIQMETELDDFHQFP